MKCYQKEPECNKVSSRNDLSKIKNGAYLIYLDGYESVKTHWRALYVDAENVNTLIVLELSRI